MFDMVQSDNSAAGWDNRIRAGRIALGLLLSLGAGVGHLAGQTRASGLRAEFHVKYLAEGAVYLDGGKNAGLEEGMKLQVKRWRAAPASPRKPARPTSEVVAEVRVLSVALVSAVCEIISSTDEIKVGDTVFLEQPEIDKAMEQEQLGSTRKYPQIISFTEGNPLDEEARAFVPRPPLPEINRARGLIGLEFGGLASGGAFPVNTTQIGGFLRADITRINGSYWALSGYWRGRLNTQSGGAGFQTVNDLVNRTYHLQLTYNNPNSRWVAGMGRLYLPWASSLDTIDGGYLGRRVGSNIITGIFAGSTPDPTSWNYSPNSRIGGAFVNFSGGSFESFRYTSTAGMAVNTIGWQEDRQFFFTENGIFYKKFLSIYHSLQADRPRVPNANGTDYTGLSRSFLTIRIQPHPRISFDINHNYFRDLPTFNQALISTGLVDQLLFQGLSFGARVDVTKTISIYNSLGRSSQTGDANASWNQMYGVTLGKIWKTGMRGDARYTEFNSSFGRGTYSALTLSHSFRDTLQWQLLAGQQNMVSTLTQNSNYRSLGSSFDWFPKVPIYFHGGFTRQQGTIMNYDQWYIGLGYRFDSNAKRRAREEGR
jgi:hypothetical protein